MGPVPAAHLQLRALGRSKAYFWQKAMPHSRLASWCFVELHGYPMLSFPFEEVASGGV